MRLLSLNFFLLCCASMWLSALAGCGEFRRIEKSPDWRIKYDAGLKYFEKKDYYHTAILFEQILPLVRGLPEGEKVQFTLAYCQFYENTYLLAANQFKTFYETYGNSSSIEEARYAYALSLYKSSLPYMNDQASTQEAIEAMQNFINRYSSSPYVENANAVLIDCQDRLERKFFESCKLYLRIEYFGAAVTTFDNFKKNFPDSKYIEEALFLKVRAQYLLSKNSIKSKQLERYGLTVDMYKEFVDTYPESKFLASIESIYALSLSEINKIKSSKPKPS